MGVGWWVTVARSWLSLGGEGWSESGHRYGAGLRWVVSVPPSAHFKLVGVGGGWVASCAQPPTGMQGLSGHGLLMPSPLSRKEGRVLGNVCCGELPWAQR
jgi:hypothetical protein